MGRGERLGITVGTAFGLVFVLVNAGPLPAAVATVLRVAAVVAFVGVQLALRRPADAAPAAEPARPMYGRGYRLVVVVEVVALFGGLQVVARVLDAPEAGVAWVATVVGLHFVALAVVWQQSSLHLLGGALTVCGVAGLALSVTGSSQAAVSTVGGVLPGVVLLVGGAWAATAGRRSRVPSRV
jgi:hypothetical protein